MAATKVCGCLNQSAPSVLCSHRRNHLHMVSFCHSMLHFACIVNDSLQLCWPFVHCGLVWCRWKQTHHFPYVTRSLSWPLCTHILLPSFCHNMGHLSMCVTGAYKAIMCILARSTNQFACVWANWLTDWNATSHIWALNIRTYGFDFNICNVEFMIPVCNSIPFCGCGQRCI